MRAEAKTSNKHYKVPVMQAPVEQENMGEFLEEETEGMRDGKRDLTDGSVSGHWRPGRSIFLSGRLVWL
jgi:hypothetical protein